MSIVGRGLGRDQLVGAIVAYGYGRQLLLPPAISVCLEHYAPNVAFSEVAASVLQEISAPVVAFAERMASVVLSDRSESLITHDTGTVDMQETSAGVAFSNYAPTLEVEAIQQLELEESVATVDPEETSGPTVELEVIPEGEHGVCG